VAQVKAHIESLVAASRSEQRAVLTAHLELVEDPELIGQAREWMARGKSAAYAWRQSARAAGAALQSLADGRMRERAADLRDLEQQVLHALKGEPPELSRDLPQDAILVADELLPSQLASFDASRIAGICTARGGASSHVALMAAALGIPALVAAGADVLAIAPGIGLLVDAEDGILTVDPSPAERAALQRTLAQRREEQAKSLAEARRPAVTRDGAAVAVYANLGSHGEVARALERGAEGCGLLRTEFLFLDRRDAPNEEEQMQEYQRIATALGGRPLTIRTMDIGADKPIPYLPLPPEQNPALGLRGLRTSLWHPELMRTQLRAMLRVQPLQQCRILLPMVTEVDEVRAVRETITALAKELGVAHPPAVGVMIETPASALLADQLAEEADFLSIGSNDLSQYTLAMDRGQPELAPRLDALHPAVLRLVARTMEAAHARSREVAVCGALASDQAAIPILVGLGVRELSAVPTAVPQIKRRIRSLDVTACTELAQRALQQKGAAQVRALLASWQAEQPACVTVNGG
jgi:phosphoenolpyruvate-protein phosphotransferase